MNYGVIFSPEAADDLDRLMIYLAEEAGPYVARNYVREIKNYCVAFSLFPKRGMARDDLRPGLRLVGYRRKATVAFRVDDVAKRVEIMRIFHHGQNVDFDGQDE